MNCKYLENGDEVIEADNGKLILANSGAYCDEEGNPIGGCIDDDVYVYITPKGKAYHKTAGCSCLANREVSRVLLSKIVDKKPCKRCCK